MRCLFSLFVGAAIANFALADVKPHALFTDHAVLQRDREISVWGTADPGEEVTVTFRKDRVSTKADASGNWMVKLPAQTAGDSDTLNIQGKNKIALRNVAVGEVWICSGQSKITIKAATETSGREHSQIAALHCAPQVLQRTAEIN
jgi:sialate O-acetylesterase